MKAFWGEVIGTFIMVFVGLATVVNAAIIGAYSGLWQVAMLWGMGLIAAITICGPISGAHFNPAITLAFASTTDFSWRKVPSYLLAQCLGALIGAALVYGVFSGVIQAYEASHGIVRGTEASIRTAMVFGEFYPNPAADNPDLENVGMVTAFLGEAVGTMILAFVIFCIIQLKELPGWMIPVLIGITLTVIISLFAPICMAGFNPARDFIPRALSYFLGWGDVVFTANGAGYLIVYILAPIVGAQIGAFGAKLLMKRRD